MAGREEALESIWLETQESRLARMPSRKTVHADMRTNAGLSPLWKSVEIVENSSHAYSACFGDYEDPDRSAGEEDSELGS